MINIKSFFKSNIFKFSSVLGFNQGLNFLLVFIYLKTIQSATYGTIGLLQSYAFLISLVSMFGIKDGFYTLYYKVDKNTLYTNIFAFVIFITITLSFISIYFKEQFLMLFSISNEFYYLIFIYAISYSFFSILEITMRLESWNRLYLSISLIRGIVVFIIKLYFVLNIENSVDFIKNILYTDIVSYIVISLVLFIYININLLKFRYKLDFSLYKRLFKVSLPFLASNGSGWIFNGFDRVLIEKYFSLEILGIYLYGTRIAYALGSIIHQILSLLYGPKSLKLLSQNKIKEMEELGEKIKSSLSLLIIGAFILSGFLYLFLKYLNIRFYNLIAVIFLASFLVEIAKIIPRINGQKLLYLEKSNILSSLSIGSSILLIFSYYLLLPVFGVGIIFISQLLVYLLVSYLTHRYIIVKTEYNIVQVSTFIWIILLSINILIAINFL